MLPGRHPQPRRKAQFQPLRAGHFHQTLRLFSFPFLPSCGKIISAESRLSKKWHHAKQATGEKCERGSGLPVAVLMPSGEATLKQVSPHFRVQSGTFSMKSKKSAACRKSQSGLFLQAVLKATATRFIPPLLQCVFPPARSNAPVEGARFLGKAKKVRTSDGEDL